MAYVSHLTKNRWLLETLVVSACYGLAFLLTFFVLYPLQLVLIPRFESYAILLYLPHGVRVLSAWLLGWRSVYALAPGACAAQCLAQYWEYDQIMMDPKRVVILLIGVTSAAVAFALLRRAGVQFGSAPGQRPSWKTVMWAGILASLINAFLVNLVLGTVGIGFLAYLVGDVFGLLFLVFLLILFFRQMRLRGY